MRVVRSLEELPFTTTPSVVTVGNFDGVHCGHRTVISQVVECARELSAQSVAVTFDPHPAVVLRKVLDLKLLTPLKRKLELLAETGIDLVLVLPFTEELSQWSARDFAQRVLFEALHAAEVHEGENFRFGRAAQAGVSGLAELGEEFCFSVRAAEPLILRGSAVSSSRIRDLIAAGSMHHARALLGRSFAIRSKPASGRGYGTRYAVPTINLSPYANLLPANGVYITTLRVENPDSTSTFQGVTNIGNRPTFGTDSFAIESHLFNFEPTDLSEETDLELTFLHRLRDERRFESPEGLKAQIGRDVQRAQRYFSLVSTLTASSL